MISAHAYSSIQAIERDAWNACFPGELENWDYLLAVEQSAMDGFQWRYLALYDNQQLVAVTSAFVTRYPLDTTIQGIGKRLIQGLRRYWPGLLQLPLYALGSPVTERCQLGIARSVPTDQRAALLAKLLELARQDADVLEIGLLAVKDAPSADPQWAASCQAAGLQTLPSLPSATLAVSFGSVDAYLGSLGKSTRKDLRRKWRAPGPRIEWRHCIDDVLPRIMQLYEATLARSDLQFERLSARYFTGVLAQLGERAACVLYWVDDELVGFNLLLIDRERMVDKFFAHDGALSLEHNLYMRSWLTNVDYCIRHAIARYECGQAGYASKIRLGCEFQGNHLFFRHRNGLFNGLLKLIKWTVRPDRYDPAMAAAISETR